MADANSKSTEGEKTPSDASKTPNPEQGDLFLCEIANWPVKDDVASMEVPLFSLSKNKDLKIRTFKRGNKSVKIIPSSVGAATVFDKDLLIYIASQIVEQLNLNKARGDNKPVSRTVQIESIDFLQGTSRGDGRRSFELIMDMLHRLRGTTIETNIPTGGVIQTEGFALIDSYKVLSEKKRVEIREDKKSGKEESVEVSRVLRFTVTISEWLYNSLLHYDVLTLDRRYFQLSKPTDRRLYEIARKHCGDQPMWKINIDSLAEKIGTDGPRFKTRDIIRDAIERDNLFEYHIALDPRASPDDVVFYTREPAKLAKELIRTGGYDWFATLEKSESRKKSA